MVHTGIYPDRPGSCRCFFYVDYLLTNHGYISRHSNARNPAREIGWPPFRELFFLSRPLLRNRRISGPAYWRI